MPYEQPAGVEIVQSGLTPNNPTPLAQSSRPGVASLVAATHWVLRAAQLVVEPAVPVEADEVETALVALR